MIVLFGEALALYQFPKFISHYFPLMSMVLGYGTVAVLNFFSSCPIRELSTMTDKIIENGLKNISSHKATGLDGIRVHMLKAAITTILPSLLDT